MSCLATCSMRGYSVPIIETMVQSEDNIEARELEIILSKHQLTQQVDYDLWLQNLRRRLHQRTVHHNLPVICRLLFACSDMPAFRVSNERISVISLSLRDLANLLFTTRLFSRCFWWPGHTFTLYKLLAFSLSVRRSYVVTSRIMSLGIITLISLSKHGI